MVCSVGALTSSGVSYFADINDPLHSHLQQKKENRGNGIACIGQSTGTEVPKTRKSITWQVILSCLVR